MSSFDVTVQTLKEIINQKLAANLLRREPTSLYSPIRYLLAGGGKRLRPMLVIISAEAVGGSRSVALDAAIAVELLHNFTLAHDDIMDQDDTRRGRPTVHAKWDESTAILAGDSMVALAYYTLLQTNTPYIKKLAQVFTKGIIEVCEGQALDKDFETSASVTIDEYLTMIHKKTARLFATSCEMGAIIGQSSEEQQTALGEFGLFLGRAFQIQDDLLDILSPEEISGKPFGSDIVQGKKTYLVLRFLQQATSAQKKRFLVLLGKQNASTDELNEVRTLFETTGTLNNAQAIVDDSLNHARNSLHRLPASSARDFLEEITQRLKVRKA